MASITPSFRDLTFDEIEEMLLTHRFGRLAFTFHDRVDIEPIHFVYEEGWVYARTGPGTKLTVLAHHPWVAFEIDDVRGSFDWRSVVVKGTVYFVEPNGSADPTYERTVRVLRRVMPEIFTVDDPAPSRTVLLRIHIDEMHGRAASSESRAQSPEPRGSSPATED
jgi:hypothetical protein